MATIFMPLVPSSSDDEGISAYKPPSSSSQARREYILNDVFRVCHLAGTYLWPSPPFTLSFTENHALSPSLPPISTQRLPEYLPSSMIASIRDPDSIMWLATSGMLVASIHCTPLLKLHRHSKPSTGSSGPSSTPSNPRAASGAPSVSDISLASTAGTPSLRPIANQP